MTSLNLSLQDVPLVYKVFPRQSDAIQFNKCFSRQLNVFAFETDASGRRNYVVCHPSRFWILYDAKQKNERHAYEVIEQNAPCKLYFDLVRFNTE